MRKFNSEANGHCQNLESSLTIEGNINNKKLPERNERTNFST